MSTSVLRNRFDRAPAAVPAAPAASLAALSVVFVSLYWLANRLTSARGDIGNAVFDWERGIPFVGWTIVPYLSICGFFVWSFFIDGDREALRRHVRCLAIALAVAIACYAAFPLRFTFERPATHGVLGLLFQGLAYFDLPYNRAPSLHITVLVILWARFTPQMHGWAGAALRAWFLLIGVSVLTTYQHHVVDVPAGLLVGGFCVAVTGGSVRRSWKRPAQAPAP